jgi:flagellar biosynthetic protein FliS
VSWATNWSGVPGHPPAWWAPPPARDACAGENERAVLLLYAEALAVLRRARRTEPDKPPDVERALTILVELAASLAAREDREAVANLAALYHYMIHRLLDVAELGSMQPVGEVERLLQTLWEGWVQVMQGDETGFPTSLEEDDRPDPRTPSAFSPS